MMPMELNTKCSYCGFDRGRNISATDDATMCLIKDKSGLYYINAYFNDDEDYPMFSRNINYCPMCGREIGRRRFDEKF